MPGRLRVGEDADVLPGVVRHSLGDEPSALVIGGREAGDEQGVAERGQIVLRHQRGISDRDVGPWGDPMLGDRNVAMSDRRVLFTVLSEALPSSGLPHSGTARSTHSVAKTHCFRSGRLSLL